MMKLRLIYPRQRLSKCFCATLGMLLVSCSSSRIADYPYGQVREAAMHWEGGFVSFSYPTGWQVLSDVTADYGSVSLRLEKRPGLKAGPLIYVEYYRSEDSPEEAAKYHERLVLSEAYDESRGIQHWQTTIAGSPARVIAYCWLPHDEILQAATTDVYETRAFVRHGDFLVQIGYYVESEAESLYKPDFEAVLSTLAFSD